MPTNISITNVLKDHYREKTDVILLAHSLMGTVRGKTANGLMIHEEIFHVVAIIDHKAVGKLTSEICQGVTTNVPIYPNMEIAIHLHKAKALIILSNPEDSWHSDIKTAIRNQLDIINTTFKFIKETPSIKTLIEYYKVSYFDLRDVSHLKSYPNPAILSRKAKVVLVTGTDCGLGKRTTAFELNKEARRRGIKSVMLATGQTGLMLGEPGTCLDALTMEYSNGVISEFIIKLSDEGYEIIFVEGQSDIFHPAYSVGTLSLLHGANPDCIVLVHDENRKFHKGFDEGSVLYKMHPFSKYIDVFKKLSLPCGPEYNTIGIATIGQENIIKIKKSVEEQNIAVADVLTSQGPVILLDQILAYIKQKNKHVFEPFHNNN